MKTQEPDEQGDVINLNRHQRRHQDAKARHGITVEPKDLLPAGVPAALNTEQAALYTGLAPATMEGLRSKGGGPRFVRYGRKAVRYLIADLDAWMAERTFSNTSEAA